MTKAIKISELLSLPLDAITNTFAIFGIRGAGKSNIGAVMAEGIIKAGQPVCIIDPTGAWYGLKSSADGRGPGLSVYVFGGEHADIPLEPTAGEVLADFVVERRVPVVLDLKLMRKYEQIRFMVAFAETLYHRNREPLMVFIDEAARFAPQTIKDKAPDAARCLGAMEDLATLGRTRGLGVTLMAQRPAPVSTTLRTQIENLICLRTIGKHDRRALDEWVEAKGTQQERDQMMKDLAELPNGVGYFWSPGWLHKFTKVHFNRRETFDSGGTPKIGQKVITPRAFAEIDKNQLSAEIQATIERAKADDPKTLRARIAELQRELEAQKKQKPAAAPAITAEQESAIRREAARSAHEQYMEPLREAVLALEDLRHTADRLHGALESAHHVAKFIDVITEPRKPQRPQLPQAPPRPVSSRIEPARHISAEAPTNGNPPPAAQRILDALAELKALGVSEAPRARVAFMAGYTNLASKGFANAIGALRSAGHIEYPGPGAIALTESGRSQAQPSNAPRSSRELQDRLISMLGGSNGRIVRELVNVHPDAIPREELAARAGYSNTASKGFANAIGRLRSLGFIEYPQPGKVRAQDVLFLD